MSALTKITATEVKLHLRTPMWTLLGLLAPSVILLAVGAIPGFTQRYPDESGPRFIDVWAPSMIVLSITMLGLQAIPAYISSYREKGVLRRMSTTPVSPAALLIAQLVINIVIATIGTALLLVVGTVMFDIPLPQAPVGFLAVFFLGTASVFSLGLLAAAVSRTSRSAGGLAMITYLPIMLVGGVYLPRQFLPEFLQRLGAYLPPGVQALQDAWTGTGPQPLQLVVLLVFSLGLGALAVKLFRWE